MSQFKQLWTNNAESLLQNDISASDTVITLQPGLGSKFPQPTNPGEFFLITLEDVNLPVVREIIKVTGRSGDNLTGVIRGWENSPVQDWSAGTTLIDHRVTAGTVRDSFIYGGLSQVDSGDSYIIVTNGDGVAGNPTITLNIGSIDINDLAGVLPISKGGTGQTTQGAAFEALSPITSLGDIIVGTGTNTSTRLPIGTNGQVLTVSGGTAVWANLSVGGSGSVTSVQISGGTTGLTASGGPITTSGTITLGGTLASTSGGTGLTSIGSANEILGVNGSGSALEYKTIVAGANVSVTNNAGQIVIASTGGGGSSLQLFVENPVSPSSPSAIGNNAVAIGSGAQANTQDSVAIGPQSLTRLRGQLAHATGRFASSGDSQFGRYMLRAATINAVPTQLFLDGPSGSVPLTLPDDSTWTFRAVITGHRTDASDGHLGFEFKGVVYRGAGANTAAIQGSISRQIIGRSNTGWNVSVAADTINGGLSFTVTGQAGKTIRWLAVVETVEVTN